MDKEFFVFIICFILGVALLLFTIGGSFYLFDKNITCPRYSKNVGLESKYDFLAGGCFVKYQDQWIPSDNLRAGKLD